MLDLSTKSDRGEKFVREKRDSDFVRASSFVFRNDDKSPFKTENDLQWHLFADCCRMVCV